MMRILLTNDDGLNSPALIPTIHELQKLGEVEVVVPRREQSWTSKSNTRRSEHIEVEQHQVEDITVTTLDALPADCANYGLFKHDNKPDLLVSGANVGHNVGIPAFFSSGTIGAALEGLFIEVPSIAISVPYAANAELIPEPFNESIQGFSKFAYQFYTNGPDNVGLAVLNLPYGKKIIELKATTVERFHYGGLFRSKGKHLRPATYHELQYPTDEVITKGSDVWARKEGYGSAVFMDYDAKFVNPSRVEAWLKLHELNIIGNSV